MKKKSTKPLVPNSVKKKKGTMQKCTFAKKLGYRSVIIVAFGLAIGLTYFGMLTSTPGKSELIRMVDWEKKKNDHRNLYRDDQGNPLLRITFHIVLIWVCIFITCHVILFEELFGTPPIPGISESLRRSRIWKTSVLVLLTVHLVSMMLGYPDMKMKNCNFLTLYAGLLLFWFLAIVMVEFMFKVVKARDEKQRIMEEEAMELELLSADKIETV